MHNGYQQGQGEFTLWINGRADAGYPDGTTSTTVAGHPASYQVLPTGADGSRTELWIISIDGQRVTISLSSGANATDAQLAEAHAIIESMRSELKDSAPGYVLTFWLPWGWDSG
jgi:hypothetical protein